MQDVSGELSALRALLARRDAELAAARAELGAMRDELEHFLHKVSHDLRAPLRHITSYGPVVREMLADGEDPSACLDTMDQSARHMGKMIDALLALSRLAKTELQAMPLPMGEIVAEAVRGVQAQAGGRQVEWHVAGDWPVVLADAGLLRQVWGHLLGNALKFTRKRPLARIDVGWNPGSQAEGANPVFFVQDNGVGFNPAYGHELFGLFQRLHSASDYEGTGLGLALAQQIVRRHGGQIEAEGTVDHGCRVSFTLGTAASSTS
jgi:two-component system OmpR family sensor kinase